MKICNTCDWKIVDNFNNKMDSCPYCYGKFIEKPIAEENKVNTTYEEAKLAVKALKELR